MTGDDFGMMGFDDAESILDEITKLQEKKARIEAKAAGAADPDEKAKYERQAASLAKKIEKLAGRMG